MTETLARARGVLESPGMYRVFQLVAVVSLLLALGVGVNQYKLTACLAAYNEATNAATAQRTEAAAADRKATDDMVKAVVEAQDREAVRKALTGYLQARAFADGQRQGNPLPGPPSQTCG